MGLKTNFGTIYIEEFDARDEEDRVKIYDSNNNYLDYIYTESEEDYNARVQDIQGLETLEDLLEYLMLDNYTLGKDYEDFLDDFQGLDITIEEMQSNEYFNKIEDTLILQRL